MEQLQWKTISAILFITIIILKAITGRRGRKLNLPPGPKPWPIIGNLNLISSLPHHSLHELSKKYGPLMHLQFGSQPVVVGSSAEMAKSILKTHDISFISRPKTASGKHLSYNYADIVWSPYGAYWRQARKMCQMELFSAKRLESYEHIRVDEVKALIRDLYKSSGSVVVLKDCLARLSFNIISRVAMGKKYLDESLSRQDLKELIDEVFFLHGAVNIGNYIRWLNFFDLQGYIKRMKAVSKSIDDFLELVLDEHNEKRMKQGKEFVAKDMVDLLLQLADDPNLDVKFERHGVKAFIQDLIGGATDTASVTVEWALTELIKHPYAIKKAVQELDQVVGKNRWVEEKDLQQLPFIEAIMKETMRLHPVAPLLIPRMSTEDVSINGYDIAAGTIVFVNVWTIGRDASIWDLPEEFRPERFVGSSIDVKGHDYELLPFGAGRRMCPGYNLGLTVVKLSLANLLHGFQWSLPEGMKVEELNMEEIFGLTTPRKFPLETVVKPRLEAHFLYE